MRRIVFIISLMLLSISVLGQTLPQRDIDSLVAVYQTLNDSDTAKLNLSHRITLAHFNIDSIISWGDSTVRLSRKQKNHTMEAQGLYRIAVAHFWNDDYDESISFSMRSLLIADSIHNNILVASNYYNMGDNYCFMNDYENSDDYYKKALEIYISLNDSSSITKCYRAIAQNLFNLKAYDLADILYHQAIAIDSANNNTMGLHSSYNGLSLMHLYNYVTNFSDPDISKILNAKRMSVIAESYASDIDYYYLFNRCFIMYYEAAHQGYKGKRLKGVLDTLKLNISQGFDVVRSQGADSEELLFHIGRINYLLLKGETKAASNLIDSIRNDVMEYGEVNYEFLFWYYLSVDNYYTSIGDFRNAYIVKSKYYECLNNTSTVDQALKSSQKVEQARFESQLRKRELDARKREDRSRVRLISIVLGALLVISFLGYEYYRKHRHNRELNEMNVQISKSNSQITDSITYASLIQKAALPKDYELSALFGKYFLIYRPLNIVAGDFYWASQVGRYSVLVCADCTGHGVPGAFVSMLGISLLNEVTANVSADTKASDILNELRAKLMRALGQNKKKYDNGAVYSMDGMDLAMVMIDYENKSLQFAGAYRPLWIWRKGELIQYKPDKMPIGIYLGPEKDFTNHVIEIKEGDALYMFSDGIPDQFGYTDDTKDTCRHFSTKQLAALLTEIGGDPLPQQKARIEKEVDAWKNGYKQLDDNILIGIRI